jgi:hypothetical protein
MDIKVDTLRWLYKLFLNRAIVDREYIHWMDVELSEMMSLVMFSEEATSQFLPKTNTTKLSLLIDGLTTPKKIEELQIVLNEFIQNSIENQTIPILLMTSEDSRINFYIYYVSITPIPILDNNELRKIRDAYFITNKTNSNEQPLISREFDEQYFSHHLLTLMYSNSEKIKIKYEISNYIESNLIKDLIFKSNSEPEIILLSQKSKKQIDNVIKAIEENSFIRVYRCF